MQPVTGIAVLDWVLGLLNLWGYLLTVAFTISENLFVIGSFTPGETVVMAAAFLSSPANGDLSLAWVWISSVVGTIIGSNITYWFGRRGGREKLVRYGRRFRINEESIAAAEAYFYTHGSKTVFFSRFAAGFKNFVPVIAGVSKMSLVHFEGWTLLGAITYTSLMCAVGYLVGQNFDRALTIGKSLGYFGLVMFLVVIWLALFGRRKFVAHRREEMLDEYAEELADEYGIEVLGDRVAPTKNDGGGAQ